MKYFYVLHTPVENHFFPAEVFPGRESSYVHGGFTLKTQITHKNGYDIFEATVSSRDDAEVYLSLCGEGGEKFFSFESECRRERIFRQSPHAPESYHFKMEKSAIPMVAAVSGEKADIFVSDNPSFFANATTQRIIPEEKRFYLSSGDPGGAPNFPESDEFSGIFHRIGGKVAHTLRFIAFRSECAALKPIRREVYRAIEAVWGKNSPSLYRATCFAGNYMHVRVNETGKSEKWIVPGIQYANCQYFRDSFYQTLIMDEETEAECYRALTENLAFDAENSLMCLIWSYRLMKNGREYNQKLTDFAFKTMLECMDKYGGGGFYPNCTPHGDFRNWFDICAFAFDDVDAYTQGLLVCALECAKRMGYETGERKEKAIARYVSLFNGEYIPLSEKKQYLALDVAVGDVLYHYLFGETFIPDGMFLSTYRKICGSRAKTPHGIKIVSAPDGSYLPVEAYGLDGYVHEGFATLDTGRYANGGSYHVYEMLFHIAAHIHGAPEAEENLIARLMIDLDFDGATHEYMHTVRGNGVKSGQGWNAGIYAIWEDIMKKGKAGDAFFAAADKKLESIK